MNQEEKIAVLLTTGANEEITETEITQEELDRIFFHDGNRTWDNIHMVLPEPVWEKIYEDGYLLYEGFTIDHKAFGAGRAFFKDGKPRIEGIFGIKGIHCGREYYPNGEIRFEGSYRLNQAYGPNFPEFGSWYGEDGQLKYRGRFSISRSSLGWPSVEEPKGFGFEKNPQPKDHTFMWEDARKYMKQTVLNGYNPEPAEVIHEILKERNTEESRKARRRNSRAADGFSPKYVQALLERAVPWSLTEEHNKLLAGKTPAEEKKIRDALALDIIAKYTYKPSVELDYREDLREKNIDERNWLRHLDQMTDGEITFMLEQQPGRDVLNRNRQAHPEISDRIRAEFLRDF